MEHHILRVLIGGTFYIVLRDTYRHSPMVHTFVHLLRGGIAYDGQSALSCYRIFDIYAHRGQVFFAFFCATVRPIIMLRRNHEQRLP